jgi:hypothetical protein
MGLHEVQGPLTQDGAGTFATALAHTRRDLQGLDVILHARTGAQLQAVDALADADVPLAFRQMWRAVAFDRAVQRNLANHNGGG